MFHSSNIFDNRSDWRHIPGLYSSWSSSWDPSFHSSTWRVKSRWIRKLELLWNGFEEIILMLWGGPCSRWMDKTLGLTIIRIVAWSLNSQFWTISGGLLPWTIGFNKIFVNRHRSRSRRSFWVFSCWSYFLFTNYWSSVWVIHLINDSSILISHDVSSNCVYRWCHVFGHREICFFLIWVDNSTKEVFIKFCACCESRMQRLCIRTIGTSCRGSVWIHILLSISLLWISFKINHLTQTNPCIWVIICLSTCVVVNKESLERRCSSVKIGWGNTLDILLKHCTIISDSSTRESIKIIKGCRPCRRWSTSGFLFILTSGCGDALILTISPSVHFVL